MEGKTLAQMSAVAFAAIAITATVLEVTRVEEAPLASSVRPGATATSDILRAELIRCQGLGEAGTRDATCLATWAESRRRFLTRAKSQTETNLSNETIVQKTYPGPVLEEATPTVTPTQGGNN